MPSIELLLASLFISGIVAYGVTHVVKLLFRGWLKVYKGNKDPWWWQGMFRLIPICIAAIVGLCFNKWPWGLLVGLCGGVLCVFLYKKSFSIIERLTDKALGPKVDS